MKGNNEILFVVQLRACPDDAEKVVSERLTELLRVLIYRITGTELKDILKH